MSEIIILTVHCKIYLKFTKKNNMKKEAEGDVCLTKGTGH